MSSFDASNDNFFVKDDELSDVSGGNWYTVVDGGYYTRTDEWRPDSLPCSCGAMMPCTEIKLKSCNSCFTYTCPVCGAQQKLYGD